MDAAHAHLVINHFPVVGSFLALPLLLLALWRRTALGGLAAAVIVLVVAGAGAAVAKVTGEGAEDRVEAIPTVSEHAIHEHERRANAAAVLAVVTGVGALAVGGWAARRGSVPGPGLAALFLLTAATAGTMAWTAQAGGWIRHTELRPDGQDGSEARRGGAP